MICPPFDVSTRGVPAQKDRKKRAILKKRRRPVDGTPPLTISLSKMSYLFPSLEIMPRSVSGPAIARPEFLTKFALRDQSQENETTPFIIATSLNNNLMSCQINYKNCDGGKHNDYTKNRPTRIATHLQFIELEGKLMNLLIT